MERFNMCIHAPFTWFHDVEMGDSIKYEFNKLVLQ